MKPTAQVPTVGTITPWGVADHVRAVMPGRVVFVSTASHGGVWVHPEMERLHIPADCQAIARQYAPTGWYEEDCDCVIPLALVPGLDAKTRGDAILFAVQMGARMAPVVAELARRQTA